MGFHRLNAQATELISSCKLRPVSHDDASLLFEWLNRPDRIAVSLDTKGSVSWSEHIKWLDTQLSDPGSQFFIIQCEDVPAGQIRFVDGTEGLEISIYVDLEFRKSGVAYQAVSLAIDQIQALQSGSNIIARVRTDNPRSRRFFENLGFTLTATLDNHWSLSKRVG